MTKGSEKKNLNRIASEDLGEVKGWLLPMINTVGNTVPSAEKEARERRRKERLRESEIIEEVDASNIPSGPITAEMLQAITREAEEEGFEQGRITGDEKGRAEGYAAGKQQALEEMRQKLTEQAERLAMVANTLIHPLAVENNALEFLLLQTIKKLSTSVVRRELQTDSSHILQLVKESLSALPTGSDHITLYLNPDDLALVENYAESIQAQWKFVGDEQLLPGGCRIETKQSLVDFSVEARLQDILKRFEEKQLSADNNEAAIAEAKLQARESQAAGVAAIGSHIVDEVSESQVGEHTDSGHDVAGQVSRDLIQEPEASSVQESAQESVQESEEGDKEEERVFDREPTNSVIPEHSNGNDSIGNLESGTAADHIKNKADKNNLDGESDDLS